MLRVLAAILAAAAGSFLALQLNGRAAPAAASEPAATELEHALARVAGEIAQRKVTIHCGGEMPESDTGRILGYVPLLQQGVADYAVLDAEICRDVAGFRRGLTPQDSVCLRRWKNGCSKAVDSAVQGLHVFTHETYHLAGEHDESAAECYALQGLPYVARRLGATKEEAAALVTYAVQHAKRSLPPQYHTPDCHEGGRLDLRPETEGLFD